MIIQYREFTRTCAINSLAEKSQQLTVLFKLSDELQAVHTRYKTANNKKLTICLRLRRY